MCPVAVNSSFGSANDGTKGSPSSGAFAATDDGAKESSANRSSCGATQHSSTGTFYIITGIGITIRRGWPGSALIALSKRHLGKKHNQNENAKKNYDARACLES
jgi:hypothetical protein